MGIHLLLLASALLTTNIHANNLTCGNTFDDVIVSGEVVTWGERIQRTLDALQINHKSLNILQDAVLDAAKLQFLQIQKPHIESLLKTGEITYRDLAVFKPLVTWETSRPETKYYFLLTEKGPYLFSLDGLKPPRLLDAKSEVGFLRQETIQNLETETYRLTVLADKSVRYESKVQAEDTTTMKVTLNGVEIAAPPKLFQGSNTNYYLQALKKRFPVQIHQLLRENKITEADLQLTQFAISAYSEAAFAVIPNASRNDFYFLSLDNGSFSLASKMSTAEHGRIYQYSNGNKSEIAQGIGFLPSSKVTTSFNQVFTDALITIQKQIEFVIGRKLTAPEAEAVATSMGYVARNKVDMNDLYDLKVFLEPYNAIGAFEIANIAIARAKDLKAAVAESVRLQQQQ